MYLENEKLLSPYKRRAAQGHLGSTFNMPLPFEVPPDSTYRLLYSGPVGVSGAAVQQSWDLSVLPQYLRERPTFVDAFKAI